jgi:hypothetical protein
MTARSRRNGEGTDRCPHKVLWWEDESLEILQQCPDLVMRAIEAAVEAR